jgi:hypothetical protein
MQNLSSPSSRLLTRSTLGPQVSEDNYGLLSLLDTTALDGFHKVGFLVESSTLSGKLETFLSSDFGDGSERCQITLQDSVEKKRKER